jgi:biotin operon repressor
MQLRLPIFPAETKLINSFIGFFERDDSVYYLHSGKPIYCHKSDDRNGYRFALANLVVNKLCTIKELSEAFGEGRKNIERYAKALREHGADHFFNRKDRRGHCHIMTDALLSAIQSELDKETSVYRIALDYGISEAAVSYHIKKGNLKKKARSLP